MRGLFFLTLLTLSACVPANTTHEVPNRRAPLDLATLPPMKLFQKTTISAPSRSNREIARDFLDLSFQMESGKNLPFMTRFEGPVSVRVIGNAPANLSPELDNLLSRLRSEAKINIHRVSANRAANITVDVVPRAKLKRFVPHAACFVVPRVASWGEYRKRQRFGDISWTTLQRREKIAIFLPGDVSPQEVRDCLHEELAQALGPLNDLYRLPDSVFNDDNFHTILTGFDMLILRAYYAPEMRNGMSRSQAASALPAILARLNPRGDRIATGQMHGQTSRLWLDTISIALSPSGGYTKRRAAASQAVKLARNFGRNDNRAAFSHYVQGRLSLSENPEAALKAFRSSNRIYRTKSVTRIQAAHVNMQLAAFALSSGNAKAAFDLANTSIPAVAASKNAALLATLMMVKAEALNIMGRADEAHQVRLDSLGWARYGFGSDQKVRDRLNKIAALAPYTTKGSP